MSKKFFDYDDGDVVHIFSNNMAIDSKGNAMLRIGKNTAIDLDSGKLHLISSSKKEDRDD